MFYDIRAHKFLNTKASGRKRLIVMNTSDGYVVSYFCNFMLLVFLFYLFF